MTLIEQVARELCRCEAERDGAVASARWVFWEKQYRREARKLVEMVRGEK